MKDGNVKYKYPFIRPRFPQSSEIVGDYEKIIESNWFTNFGPFESQLCADVANIYTRPASVTTIANATLGLQAAVDILIDHQGDKRDVIIPSFTFAAGAEVILKAGFRPVFIDIDADSWQPSLSEASNYIRDHTDKVAGIVLGNTFGTGNSDIGKWELLAQEYGLPLIVDSAAGFGSLYEDGEKLGLRGDCEIFSMHATKPFAVGEGGLVISKNKDLIERIRFYQNFGFNNEKNIATLGTNAKLQELNCAIGIRQLEGFEERLLSRRSSLQYYIDRLSPVGFTFIKNGELSSVCFASALAPNQQLADQVRGALYEAGVESRQYYVPLHKQELLRDVSVIADSIKNTEDVYSRIISLPVYDDMSSDNLEYITNIILEVQGGASSKG